MNIIDILENKTAAIISGSDSVGLTGEEMNILCDPIQLRTFKIFKSMPVDFKCSQNIEECIQKIREGDSLYRTLEYCIITNRALQNIRDIFGMKEIIYAD